MARPNTHFPKRRKRGFERASAVLTTDMRRPAEKRGFAQARILTHWTDIVGAEIAQIARPVKISHGRGFGGTLILLTTGAHAPILEMCKDQIVEKVNACYGYRAISRVRITQTAPTELTNTQTASPSDDPQRQVDPDRLCNITAGLEQVHDADLRTALGQLARNVLIKPKI